MRHLTSRRGGNTWLESKQMDRTKVKTWKRNMKGGVAEIVERNDTIGTAAEQSDGRIKGAHRKRFTTKKRQINIKVLQIWARSIYGWKARRRRGCGLSLKDRLTFRAKTTRTGPQNNCAKELDTPDIRGQGHAVAVGAGAPHPSRAGDGDGRRLQPLVGPVAHH